MGKEGPHEVEARTDASHDQTPESGDGATIENVDHLFGQHVSSGLRSEHLGHGMEIPFIRLKLENRSLRLVEADSKLRAFDRRPLESHSIQPRARDGDVIRSEP